MADMSLAHLEAFLEMMSVERGAAVNTLTSYRNDLEDCLAFLRGMQSNLTSATSDELRACLADVANRDLLQVHRQDAFLRCVSSIGSSIQKAFAMSTRQACLILHAKSDHCRNRSARKTSPG